MKSVFSVSSDGAGQFPGGPTFDIAICFNGVPGTVVLEVIETKHEGYSCSSSDPVATVSKQQVCVMRALLKASHARAIASALLSAATEVGKETA